MNTSRALIIFSVLFVLLILSSSLAIYAGLESGDINKKIVQPLKDSYNNFLKSLEPTPLPPSLPTIESPTPTSVPLKQSEPDQSQIYYPPQPSPQYNYPTPIPGRPGSKEWEEDFWKTWEEKGKWIEEKNKEVEEAQKKFCEQNPTLCGK